MSDRFSDIQLNTEVLDRMREAIEAVDQAGEISNAESAAIAIASSMVGVVPPGDISLAAAHAATGFLIGIEYARRFGVGDFESY